MQYYNGNKVDCLKRLYKAHEIIADITKRINSLYTSATSIIPISDGMPKNQNPKRFEGIMTEYLDLKTLAQTYLKKRAVFDYFVSTLIPFYRRILDLRCEDCLQWKEIASNLDISIDTAKRVFKCICKMADEAGLFDET